MSQTTDELDQIQKDMRLIRAELRDGVQGLVDNARDLQDLTSALTDWTHYVRNYPWLTLGAAAAIGYWIVPSRPVVRLSTKSATKVADQVQKQMPIPPPQEPARSSFFGALAGMAASTLFNVGMKVGSQFLMEQLEPQLSAALQRRAADESATRKPGAPR